MSFLSDVRINIANRPFTSDSAHCYVAIQNEHNTYGVGISLESQRKANLCAIGELFEREMIIVSRFDDIFASDKVKAYSIVDRKIELVDKKYVHPIKNEINIIDSCGLASHVSSHECIKSSYEEFVERQSFVFGYLTKTPGIKINLQDVEKYRFVKNIFPACVLQLYNISLTDMMYVIFGKVYYEGRVCVGVGCSSNIDIAISGCIRELIQSKGFTKNENSEIDITKLDYGDYGALYKALPQDKIWNAYSYLDTGDMTIDYKNLVNKEYDIEKISLDLYKNYKIKPLIAFLQNRRFNTRNIKITRVFDKHWFKSLLVKYYDKDDLDYIEATTNKKLDRKCTFIPFP